MSLKSKSKSSLKVIVVGSSGVGKTSLINCFFDRPFENSLYSTVSPSYMQKSLLVDSHKVDLHIWDTAGQEQFQDIGRAFYHGSDVAVVCFDYQHPIAPTNSSPSQSKEATSRENIKMWVKRVRDQVENCFIFLAATKCDEVYGSEEIGSLNQFSNEVASELELTGFYLTSAKNKMGIEELFYEIARCDVPSNDDSTLEENTNGNSNCSC
ncbi:GTP-binding protein YPT7 [Tritrichomonas foetus]|uniref:GTP-binding protein YPT7 n=1 Tax=Tritrichomonas foetus TaxID=1144522 RepID=A0A1J4KAD4_9EUKA|nr:GTP-binding protein YPT7 [Tritrichomonas foetus]|eukprot:OHT08383.1 GTP-binding protein YPT7 [Tritrichomonas foetus]